MLPMDEMETKMKTEDSVLQDLWIRRLGLASSKKPKWILESFLGPFVVYFLFFLISKNSNKVLAFTVTTYVVYLFGAAYIFVILVQKKKLFSRKKLSKKAIAILYAVYDCATLAIFSFGFLGIAVYSLDNSMLLGKFNNLIVGLSVGLYVILSTSIVLFRKRLLFEQAKHFKSNSLIRLNFGILISNGMISFGMLVGQLLSRSGEYSLGYFLVYILAMISSMCMLPIWQVGVIEILLLYMNPDVN
jgi:hypothetical protein